MAAHIALLRAVNVGGRKLLIAELKAVFESLGFTRLRTLLQSGNIIFESAQSPSPALEAALEAETEKRLKLRTDYLVRSPDEWSAVVRNNPFPREAKDDPGHLLVLPLKSTPTASDVAALRAVIQGRETVTAIGRELYAYYPDGVGRSKLTIALIERKLKTRGTGRNWNTVLKIQAALESR